MIALALITLNSTKEWTGKNAEAERWLHRTKQAEQADTEPDNRLLLNNKTEILRVYTGQ